MHLVGYKEDQHLTENMLAFHLDYLSQPAERNGGFRVYAGPEQGRRLAAE